MQGSPELRAQSNGLARLKDLPQKPEEVHGEAVTMEMYRDPLTNRLHITEYHSANPLIAVNPDGRKVLQAASAKTLELKQQWELDGARGVFRTDLTRNMNAGCIPIQTASNGEMYFLDIIKSYKTSEGYQYALDNIAGGPNLKRNLEKAAIREFLEEALIWNTDKGLHLPSASPEIMRWRLSNIRKQILQAQSLGLAVPDDFQAMLLDAYQRSERNDFSLISPVSFGQSPLPHLNDSEITIVEATGCRRKFNALTFFHSQGADAMFPMYLPSGNLRTLDTECLKPPEEQIPLARHHALLTLANNADLLQGRPTKGIEVTPSGSFEHTFDPKLYPYKPLGFQVTREFLLM